MTVLARRSLWISWTNFLLVLTSQNRSRNRARYVHHWLIYISNYGQTVKQKQKQSQVCPPPVDIHIKLWPDCKTHVMELFPELFDGVGTIKDAIVKLNVDESITPVIQPPRKIPQTMVDPLKQEIERMMMLGVIRKLDINRSYRLVP